MLFDHSHFMCTGNLTFIHQGSQFYTRQIENLFSNFIKSWFALDQSFFQRVL